MGLAAIRTSASPLPGRGVGRSSSVSEAHEPTSYSCNTSARIVAGIFVMAATFVKG
jgi:hypothetical protein